MKRTKLLLKCVGIGLFVALIWLYRRQAQAARLHEGVLQLEAINALVEHVKAQRREATNA